MQKKLGIPRSHHGQRDLWAKAPTELIAKLITLAIDSLKEKGVKVSELTVAIKYRHEHRILGLKSAEENLPENFVFWGLFPLNPILEILRKGNCTATFSAVRVFV